MKYSVADVLELARLARERRERLDLREQDL